MTSQTVNLNLIPSGTQPVINVSQYDHGQTWYFNIYASNVAYEIPSGASVTIQGTKKDNTGFQYACTFDGSVVTATEEQQMTIYSGDVQAELVITYNDALIGSINFIIRVEPAALSDDTVISETELPLIEAAAEIAYNIQEYLEEAEQHAEDAQASAEDAEASAEDAEAWAVGTRNGVAVTSDDETYENNAKYYVDNFLGYMTDTQWANIQALY